MDELLRKELEEIRDIEFEVEQIIIEKFKELMPDRYPLSLNAESLRKRIFTHLHSKGLALVPDEFELPELPGNYDTEDNNYLYYMGQDDTHEKIKSQIRRL